MAKKWYHASMIITKETTTTFFMGKYHAVTTNYINMAKKWALLLWE